MWQTIFEIVACLCPAIGLGAIIYTCFTWRDHRRDNNEEETWKT